jgi:hypothetical protein
MIKERNKGTIAIFDIEHTRSEQPCDFMFVGPCESTLGEALGLLEEY